MSSILSAQNLQTLRRRNIGRRWPCCLSPVFLSPPRPRPPPPPPPPDRPCPNATSALHSVKTIVVAIGLIGLRGTTLARLPHRREPALHAPPLRRALPLGPRPVDDLLLLIDAHDQVANHLIHDAQPPID